jgi:hypothetical protein
MPGKSTVPHSFKSLMYQDLSNDSFSSFDQGHTLTSAFIDTPNAGWNENLRNGNGYNQLNIWSQ